MNTARRLALPLSLLSLTVGCLGAPDAADLEAVAQTEHALTYAIAPTPLAASLLGNVAVQVARATINGFTPATGAAGTRVMIQGTALDRNRAGRITLGGLGYTVSFAGVNGARVAVPSPRLLSATQLEVFVPAGAATGRVRFSDALGSFSESAVDFVVPVPPPPPAPTRVRITNNNQYDIVTLVVNGATLRSCANPLAPGASLDVNVMPGGFAVGAVLGFCTGGTPTSIPPSHLEFNGNIANGQTFTVTANAFTLGELLTNWGFNSGEWASDLFLGVDGAWHQSTFAFDGAARWTGFDRGTAWASGQARLVSWPNRASCVQFSLAPNAATTQLCLPFSGFTQDGINHVRR
jgi:hypothetical protein